MPALSQTSLLHWVGGLALTIPLLVLVWDQAFGTLPLHLLLSGRWCPLQLWGTWWGSGQENSHTCSSTQRALQIFPCSPYALLGERVGSSSSVLLSHSRMVPYYPTSQMRKLRLHQADDLLKVTPCGALAVPRGSAFLGVDGGWEGDVNFRVQPGWSHSPHNLLIPLHVASLHMGHTSGPPKALGGGGEGDCPVSAGGQHEDRPGRGGPGFLGKGPSSLPGCPPCTQPTSVVHVAVVALRSISRPFRARSLFLGWHWPVPVTLGGHLVAQSGSLGFEPPLPVLRALVQDLVGVGLMDPKGETKWGVSRGLNRTL